MEKIGVYGTGTIGSCQITLITGNGLPVVGISYDEADRQRSLQKIEQNWNDLIALGLATEKNKEAAMRLVTLTTDPKNLRGCTFIFEEVLEDIEIKRETYAAIEANTDRNTVVASSTSSLDAEILASVSGRPEMLLITHPFQPVHLQPLVEVVGNRMTSPEAFERTQNVLESLKRVVVVLKKSAPGFIVNRLAQTLFRESLYMIERGITTPEDIDKAVKYAVGMRYTEIGLMEYFDAVGFELESAIAKNVYPDLCNVKEVQDLVKKGLETGKTGKSAGKGLFDWSERSDADYRRRLNKPYLEGVRGWNLPE